MLSPKQAAQPNPSYPSVPELGGSRPDRLSGVRPQERVPRRIVVQIADSAPVLPLLHDPEPQLVDSMVEVLKILDKLLPDVEQVIEVPKITQHTVFQGSSLQELQLAEQLVMPSRAVVLAPRVEDQLVEVPPIVPQVVPRSFCAGADGYGWSQISGPEEVYWWRVGTSHTLDPPPAFSARPGRDRNTGRDGG